jgi:hypothetical protein
VWHGLLPKRKPHSSLACLWHPLFTQEWGRTMSSTPTRIRLDMAMQGRKISKTSRRSKWQALKTPMHYLNTDSPWSTVLLSVLTPVQCTRFFPRTHTATFP